jgi:hypothetical protein
MAKNDDNYLDIAAQLSEYGFVYKKTKHICTLTKNDFILDIGLSTYRSGGSRIIARTRSISFKKWQEENGYQDKKINEDGYIGFQLGYICGNLIDRITKITKYWSTYGLCEKINRKIVNTIETEVLPFFENILKDDESFINACRNGDYPGLFEKGPVPFILYYIYRKNEDMCRFILKKYAELHKFEDELQIKIKKLKDQSDHKISNGHFNQIMDKILNDKLIKPVINPL